ncbi:protein FAM184B isoform X2 [Brienomyrus brachyistius]|uniref:protein FAM184B isoform X2 n=1 Tax=Brienomyrus brachyistius TaxID=42636 RepID=UPI0020B3CDC3|nr:protein FAM184B isoform X2 [Brienomyrus brachyistius]
MASSSGKATQSSGACNGTAADFPNIEQELYDYQMHTKMCKKIAQLTKVIYSLNTKQEEHEAALQSLREAHQQEVRRIAEEAQGKLVPSKGRLEGEIELQRRLQVLEDSLEVESRLKEEILADFDSYRRQVEEEGVRVEAHHTERLAAVSREALDVREELESRLQEVTSLKEQLEEEKEHAISELELARQECRGLQEECQELRRSILDERGRLEEACQASTHALREELETLQEERRDLEERCRRTVNELKEAQQEEQETLRKTLQQSLAEKLNQWQQRELEQRTTLQASLQQKLKKAEEELEAKQQRLSESRRHCLKLQERAKELEGQLEEARHRVAEAEGGARKVEEELAVAKERLLLQENELQSKSEELVSQWSSQSKTTAEAEELRGQVTRLQSRVKELEVQSSGKTSDHVRQVKQHAEALVTQRQELQRAHAEELRRLRQQTEEERARLRDQLRKGLEEVMRKHAGELRTAQASADAERKKAQKVGRRRAAGCMRQGELQMQTEEFRKRHEEERRELEREKEVLCARLQESVREISRLEAMIQQAASVAPQTELAPPSGELEQVQRTAARMKEDLESQTEKHQAEISTLRKEMETLEERISEQAARSQEEKIRAACESLRKELTEQHLLTLSHLQREKEAEEQRINESWWKKVQDLQSQLEEANNALSTEIRDKEDLHPDNDQDILKQRCQENVKLNYSLKGSGLQEKGLLAEQPDIKELEEAFRRRHEEALRAERHSHQMALRALEERAQAEAQAERLRQQTQQKLLLDRQKAELTQQHADWSKQVTQRHMQQMEDLQAELRTHTELVALQQDFKQQNQVQAFERQLDECHSEVLGLKRENSELKEQLTALTQELCQIQGMDQHQRRSRDEEMDCLKREHRKAIQSIMADFSSAQTRLQARIVTLETELREKDEKSKGRESRTEDLHVIGKLHERLNEREQVIKRLLEERHQLQQHLHVPSDNVTKAYENRPQPGSLTPTLRKNMEEKPPRVTSVPNLTLYEKGFLIPDSMPGAPCHQTVKSPSFEYGRNVSRTGTPTGTATLIPELRQGARYNRSPSEEAHQALDSYSQPPRNPCEQRLLESGPDAQDPQPQEWFTKYFSF